MVLMAGIILVASFFASQAGAQYQRIDGDPLRIDSYDNDGRLAVYRLQSGSYVNQYFGENSWGSVLVLNGVGGGLKFGSSYFSGITLFTPVSNTKPDDWTIVSVYDAGGTGVRITQTISYTNGNAYYRKVWQIENRGSTTYTDNRFLHGGDSYFAGIDSSRGNWNAALGMVYLTNPDLGVAGIMGFYGATPADHHYEDQYGSVRTAIGNGQLPDTVNPNYVDAGYALQWNRATLAPGETWTIVSFEKWTESGFVQVFAPAEQTGGPGSVINYQFAVANFQASDASFNLALTSSNGWATSLPGGNTVTVPAGGSVSVNATVTIPAGAAAGTRDILTLRATSQADGAITNADSVTTIVPGQAAPAGGISQSGGGGGSGCFIATAAYGSYMAEDVMVLRHFRDNCLLTNSFGRAFVRVYYKYSPPAADYIAKHEGLRKATRIALTPVVYGVKYPAGLFLLAGLMIGLVVYRKKSK